MYSIECAVPLLSESDTVLLWVDCTVDEHAHAFEFDLGPIVVVGD